jgi:hypothetical protein
MRFMWVWLKKLKMHNPQTKNLSVVSQPHFHSLPHATRAPFDLQIFARDHNRFPRSRVSVESIIRQPTYEHMPTVTLVSTLQHTISVTRRSLKPSIHAPTKYSQLSSDK